MRAILAILFAATCLAETRYVVQISEDGTETIPPQSIATPHQVQQAQSAAAGVLQSATNLHTRVEALEEQCARLGTNLVITSTCYVKSIGGVAYNPDLQYIRLTDITMDGDDVQITGLVTQVPLTPPALDWRVNLGADAGGWQAIPATVDEITMPAQAPVPPDKMQWRKAYRFTLPRPDAGSGAFFRVVDNSSGASGSGLYWVVFGGIVVDGQVGKTVTIYDDNNNKMVFRGGVLTEENSL